MRIEADKLLTVHEPILPEGFSFAFFCGPESIKDWCRIETSVLEFNSEADAEEYYTKAYLPYIHELKNRCVFVMDQKSVPIATATIRVVDSELGHQVSLQWVSVCPEYQGLGIGKAIVKKCLKLLHEMEPWAAVWLHTQTWSYVAIWLYHRLGFNILKTERLANINTKSGLIKIYPNDFSQAIEVLWSVLDKETIRELVDTAI